ncbi:hypothetical protein GCM10027612_28880 [Microbispora bryophytorum subsp. camponoti]
MKVTVVAHVVEAGQVAARAGGAVVVIVSAVTSASPATAADGAATLLLPICRSPSRMRRLVRAAVGDILAGPRRTAGFLRRRLETLCDQMTTGGDARSAVHGYGWFRRGDGKRALRVS